MLSFFFRCSPKEVRAHARFAFIRQREGKWPTKTMCRVLSVSEAGYYRYRRNLGKPSRDVVLSAAMQAIRAESAYNDNYGVPRMRLTLQQCGFRVGLRRVRRLMVESGWLHPPRRRPYGLTHATTEIQEKENLIKQDFSAAAPFTKLLTDIS